MRRKVKVTENVLSFIVAASQIIQITIRKFPKSGETELSQRFMEVSQIWLGSKLGQVRSYAIMFHEACRLTFL
jgi:hypothetical protein